MKREDTASVMSLDENEGLPPEKASDIETKSVSCFFFKSQGSCFATHLLEMLSSSVKIFAAVEVKVFLWLQILNQI